MMANIPDRIWATGNNTTGSWNSEKATFSGPPETEYIHADLVLTWQPIETAPKDGTKIILRCDDVVVAPCYWQPAGVISESAFWLWEAPEHRLWMETVEGPTHWMPLPQVPEIPT